MADILSRPVVCINLINACFQSVITWALTIRRRDHNNLISTKQGEINFLNIVHQISKNKNIIHVVTSLRFNNKSTLLNGAMRYINITYI